MTKIHSFLANFLNSFILQDCHQLHFSFSFFQTRHKFKAQLRFGFADDFQKDRGPYILNRNILRLGIFPVKNIIERTGSFLFFGVGKAGIRK
jgi:hypothetical protein